MRRSRCGRILTGLLTLWLALTQSDIAVLHAWPAQGRAHAAASAACPSHSATMHHDAHGDHGSPASHDDAQRCCCCCACVAPATISSPAALVALVPGARLLVVPPATIATVEYHHTAPAHARPPSQGPPIRPA